MTYATHDVFAYEAELAVARSGLSTYDRVAWDEEMGELERVRRELSGTWLSPRYAIPRFDCAAAIERSVGARKAYMVYIVAIVVKQAICMWGNVCA